jgi:hypothetical protein
MHKVKKSRKYIAALLITVMCCIILSIPISAANYAYYDDAHYISLQIDNPNYILFFWEKHLLELDDDDPGIMPILHEGRTMLPMRAVSRIISFDGPIYYNIEWYGDEMKAVLIQMDDSMPGSEKLRAEFWIGRNTAVFYDDDGKNPRKEEIPVAPILRNSRTYLPLRAIAEALDIGIEWAESKQGVILYFYGMRPRTVTLPDNSVVNI